jgi:hypothetical protein
MTQTASLNRSGLHPTISLHRGALHMPRTTRLHRGALHMTRTTRLHRRRLHTTIGLNGGALYVVAGLDGAALHRNLRCTRRFVVNVVVYVLGGHLISLSWMTGVADHVLAALRVVIRVSIPMVDISVDTGQRISWDALARHATGVCITVVEDEGKSPGGVLATTLTVMTEDCERLFVTVSAPVHQIPAV